MSDYYAAREYYRQFVWQVGDPCWENATPEQRQAAYDAVQD